MVRPGTTVEPARSDLAAGRVVSYEWGDSWTSEGAGVWNSAPQLQGSNVGSIFAWSTGDRRTHHTTVDRSETSPDRAFTESVAGGAALVGGGATFRPQPVFATITSALFGLAVLAFLIGGPARSPAHGGSG